MRFRVREKIKEGLKNYHPEKIYIFDKEYTLYLVPDWCDEDLNLFEGFLFIETNDRSEVSNFKTRYTSPVSGYAARIGLILYDGRLLIKDFRGNRYIVKTLKKINESFMRKLENLLTQPTKQNISRLFDRTDIIEEFYILFKKSRDYLLSKISGISEESKREEFVDNFMMQMLTLWYLQERGFFDRDTNYFITKFKELKQGNLFGSRFGSYYEFLTYFFEKVKGGSDDQYYSDKVVGNVVVVGPAVFINGEESEAVTIPDECFYQEGVTDVLIETPPKRVGDEVPLLNLFESRDWTEGNIDEFVLGAIKVVSELKHYLESIAMSLKIGGDVVKEVEDLNRILSKEEIDWNDFEKVLRTKEKLIRILIASLNSRYAMPLNGLLREITDLFNQKLDEKFAQEYNIDLRDLKNIKTFHWFFEFPEVFLDRDGFDIVVGNPPYGNILKDIEKEICGNYASYTGEIASVFVERSIPFNKENGYFSFIITYAITFSKDLSGTRKIIFDSYEECKISTFDRDKCRFFDNMTQSVSIMICKRKSRRGNCRFYTTQMFRTMPDISRMKFQFANNFLLGDKVGVNFNERHRLPKIGEEMILEILKEISQNKKTIGDIIIESGENIWIRTSGNYWYNAWDREPYQNTEIRSVTVAKEYKDFLLLLVNSSTYYLWFRIYGDGRHMNIDIMKALPIPSEEKIEKVNSLLNHLSHILMNFLFYNFDKEHYRFNTSNVKPIIDICDIVIGKLYGFSREKIDFILNFEDVVRGGKKIPDVFFTIVDYALFTEESIGESILDYSLIDCLVYELYFKEKFAEDGLYPEPEKYLLFAVSKHLRPINYDRWAELYWKKQLEGDLTPEKQKELEELERENLETVEEVYMSLNEDGEVQSWIGKIRSHEWVRFIEEKQ